jgi:CheY-like chemotaxis protein
MSSPISVLVADDEPDVRFLVRVVLERAGLQVVAEAVDGHDALAAVVRLAAHPIPAVLVLDNEMPGVAGLDVAARVLAVSPQQCIVLFTANLTVEVKQRAQQVGIRTCVPKTAVQSLPSVITALAIREESVLPSGQASSRGVIQRLSPCLHV